MGDVAGVEGVLALGVVGDAVVVGVGGEPLVGLALAVGLADLVAVVFAEDAADVLEGVGVGDAVEDELGLEEGEEAVGGVLAPAVAGLG